MAFLAFNDATVLTYIESVPQYVQLIQQQYHSLLCTLILQQVSIVTNFASEVFVYTIC